MIVDVNEMNLYCDALKAGLFRVESPIRITEHGDTLTLQLSSSRELRFKATKKLLLKSPGSVVRAIKKGYLVPVERREH